MAEIGVVISGIGQSAIGKKLDRTGIDLTLDAVLEAIANAGLTREDIDGVSCYPGARPDMPGFGPVAAFEVIDALRLNVDWYSSGMEGAAQFSAIINAYAAIKAGLVRHVVCFRTVKEGSMGATWKDAATAKRERARVSSEFQWSLPFNAIMAMNWLAPYAQRHFDLYGTKREHLGAIAVNARRNAQINPKALYRDPMTMDDYLASKFISTPFCLFDCDAPTDGSTAILLSNAEVIRDLKSKPIHVESVGSALHSRPSWDQVSIPRMAAFDAAEMMWKRSSYKPSDMKLAEIYDGFSFLTLTWLEALGFCGVGESGPFVEGGKRIARDGSLPLNTHGGQLSGGRTHGFGFVHEAVLQLRGEAGERQVPNEPKVGVAAAGGGPLGGCMVLVRD